MSVYYDEQPRITYKLESSYRCESKTRQYPFVVASEVERENATREFLVFHDLEHFLNLKNKFPYCHEIIRCPEDRENLAKGRLIFDFDLKEPMNGVETGFVPDDFNQTIEALIKFVFTKYYLGVVIDKLIFVWQVTHYDNKFSKHLIVKNAYFSEYWVKQMKIFYELFRKSANENGLENYMKSVDFQIARKNGTFRIIGCSKIGKSPLELESPNNAEIYDCLVGIYDHNRLREEQRIGMSNINYSFLTEKLNSQPLKNKEEKRFKSVITNNITLGINNHNEIDVTNGQVNKACDIFNTYGWDSFKIRDNTGNIINLDRTKSGICPISGQIHERENAYLIMKSNGHLLFCCRRGCKNKFGNYGFDLGIYRTEKRPKGILPINIDKLKSVINTTTVIDNSNKVVSEIRDIGYKNYGGSARRVIMKREMLQIPSFLKVN